MEKNLQKENENERKSEKVKTENKPSIWPQILSASTAGMAGAMQGTVYAFPTRALPQLTLEEDLEMRLSPQAASWFAAMYMALAICICPVGGIISNMIGRRKCFMAFTTIGTVGWVGIALSPNVPALFVGRFLTNIAASGLSATIGVHIAETVHSSVRGSLAVFQSIFIGIGMLIVLGLGYCVQDWRTLAWICMIPGCIHLIMIFFLPDTPYWLMEKNMREEARKSLQFYRGSDYDITSEFGEILKQNEEKVLRSEFDSGRMASLKRIASPAFGRPFLCIGVLFLINQCGEFTNLVIHMINIFREAKSSIEPELAPVFVGIVQVLSAITSSFLMRRASTKILFVTCYSIVILADISLATFSYLKNHSEDAAFLEDLGWLPLLFVTCIVSAHSIGVYPVINLLMGELFPSDIRSLAIGLTLSAALCSGTTNILIYQFLISGLEFFGTFYYYAGVSFVALLWGIFNIPDNRGLSLAKVEAKFSEKSDQKKKLDEVE